MSDECVSAVGFHNLLAACTSELVTYFGLALHEEYTRHSPATKRTNTLVTK
jgi:hypothetical protein